MTKLGDFVTFFSTMYFTTLCYRASSSGWRAGKQLIHARFDAALVLQHK